MLSYIEHVEITDFWGNHHVNLPLKREVNFLIGPNGSGKTTVINLVAAALRVDLKTLGYATFSRIRIKLHRVSPYAKPIVEVRRAISNDSARESLEYHVYPKAGGSAEVFDLSDYYAWMYRRRGRIARQRSRATEHDVCYPIRNRIANLCDVSWLTVHRAEGSDPPEESQSEFTSVDSKLMEISGSISQYFGLLQKRATEEVAKFQESLVLSLISEQKQEVVLNRIKEIDLDEEEKSLARAFEEVDIPREKLQKKISQYFSHLRRGIRKVEKGEGVSLTDFYVIANSLRLNKIVSEWHDLDKRKERIFRLQEAFLSVVNSLFERKELKVRDNNDMYVKTRSGKDLTLLDLSSGEKQLLIVLGQALLQREENAIFIADEPELSLHVEWQSRLVDSIRALNKNSQIVFATHSPDIVGRYGEDVHNMTEIIS